MWNPPMCRESHPRTLLALRRRRHRVQHKDYLGTVYGRGPRRRRVQCAVHPASRRGAPAGPPPPWPPGARGPRQKRQSGSPAIARPPRPSVGRSHGSVGRGASRRRRPSGRRGRTLSWARHRELSLRHHHPPTPPVPMLRADGQTKNSALSGTTSDPRTGPGNAAPGPSSCFATALPRPGGTS